MNLAPAMGTVDRLASLAAGVVLIVYASLGSFDSTIVAVGAVLLGIALAVGGLGGT